MKKKRNKKRMFIKKAEKVLLRILLAFVIILVAFIIYLRFLFPNEKVRLMAIEKLGQALERPVFVEQVTINPFGRVDLKEVTLGQPENAAIPDSIFFHVNRLSIYFRLLPLLRRQAVVTGILIDSPRLHIISEKEDVSAAEPRQSVPRVKNQSVEIKIRPSESPLALPLSFGLIRLVLRDFNFTVTMPDNSGESELIAEGLHLELNNLRFPRDFQTAPHKLRGAFRLFTEKGRLFFRDTDINLSLSNDMDLSGEWRKYGEWDVYGDIRLSPVKSSFEDQLRLNLGLKGIGFGDKIHIEKTDLSLNSQRIIDIQGNLINLGPNIGIEINVDGEDLDLHAVSQGVYRLLPRAWTGFLENFKLDGAFSIGRGFIKGKLDSLEFDLHPRIQGAAFSMPETGLVFRNGNTDFQMQGVMTSNGLRGGMLRGDLSFDPLRIDLNDTTVIQINHTSLNIKTRLDKYFIPSLGELSGMMETLNGDLNLNLFWVPVNPQNTGLENLRIRGDIHGDSLDLARIPGLSSQIKGDLNLDIEFGIESLKDFYLHLRCATDSLSYPLGETVEMSPPLYLNSDLYARTDQFQNWFLDSAFFLVPDLLDLQLTGQYRLQDQKIGLSVKKGVIHNTKIPDFLPDQIIESFGDISLNGEEQIVLALESYPVEKERPLLINGELLFNDVGIALPRQALQTRGIQGSIKINGPLDRHRGRGEFSFKEVSYPLLRKAPVSNGQVTLSWHFSGFDSLYFESGNFVLETLGLTGTLSALIISSPETRLSAEAVVAFDSEGQVEILEGMDLCGGFSTHLKGEIGHPEIHKMTFSGNIQFNSLCFSQGESILIEDIRGRLPLEMSMDIAQNRFVPRKRLRYPPADEYEVQRHLYRSMFPDLGTLTIGKINVDRYQFADLMMDVDMGSGYLVIPWFRVYVFDGNFGGSLGLNYGSGTPEEITYEIRAHASRINSASLLEETGKEEEETELNATMAFQGRGIDLAAGIDLDGYFHLTQIGPRFASTLLRGMDPNGSDRSIRLTRRLLDMGWKPKLFSFELRHGYVYPSLALSQPWFSPIRLPRELKYGRLPLEFFINPK